MGVVILCSQRVTGKKQGCYIKDASWHAGNIILAPLLTHLPLDKMAAALADDIFKWIILNENGIILIRISLKFIPKGPICNKSALVQAVAWRQTGDTPLPEPMLTQFPDAYMWH